jgi:hypothetical protein
MTEGSKKKRYKELKDFLDGRAAKINIFSEVIPK